MKALLWRCRSIVLALLEYGFMLTGCMVWEIKKASEIEIPDE
jgi:hypothetical protein